MNPHTITDYGGPTTLVILSAGAVVVVGMIIWGIGVELGWWE